MIVNKEAQQEILGVDPNSTVDMKIDDSDKAVLMMILSQGLYADGVGSLIRELTTNALDAQREANNDNPIKVKLVEENGRFVFMVQDEGVGLSPDRVENVFSKYCSSTKRNSADQLGFFGLGSKSPLAYTDHFYIISRHEGKEYKYMMFKGENGTQLTLEDINETTEHNGVTIKVYLKSEYDYDTFLQKMKTQLAYFEGVFFETEYDDIDNSFKIVKNENWKYSELNTDTKLHVSLDNVYYPLDFNQLGIPVIKMPIALNLSLKDGIMPTPNRESLQYSPATKKLLLYKIQLVADYFITKWNDVAPTAATLHEASKLLNNIGQVVIYQETDEEAKDNLRPSKPHQIIVKIDKEIESLGTVRMNTVTLPEYPHLPVGRLCRMLSHLMDEYQVVAKLDNRRYTTKLSYHPGIYYGDGDKYIYLKTGEVLSKVQADWLKSKNKSFEIVRKAKPRRLGKLTKNNMYGTNSHNYYGLLELWKIPRQDWRVTIQEFQKMLDKSIEALHWHEFDFTVPTDAWLEQRKLERGTVNNRRILANEEVTVRIGREKEVYDYYNKPVYDLQVKKIGDLHKMSGENAGVYVYATEKDKDALYPIFQIGLILQKTLNYKKGKHYTQVNTALVSERSYKKIGIVAPHNWISLEDFLTKKNRVMSNFLTSYLLNKYKESFNNHFLFEHNYFIEQLNPEIAKNIKAYKQSIISFWKNLNNVKAEFLYPLLKLYNDNKWFNLDMIAQFNNYYKVTPDLDFLTGIDVQPDYNYGKERPIQTTMEMKISKILYRKFALENYKSNQQRNCQDFINQVLSDMAPQIPQEIQQAPEEAEEGEAAPQVQVEAEDTVTV